MKNYRSSHQLLRRSLRIFIALLLAFNVSAFAKPVVIGYIPAFRDMKTTIDSIDLNSVTHINISFLNPDANGNLIKNDSMLCMPDINGANTTGDNLRYVINKAHQAGIKVLVSVAGGVIPGCSADWSVFLRASNRQLAVDGFVKFVDDFNLDGLDVDIEGAVLTSIDKAGNYTPFIQALSDQLKPRNKLLTCATASYDGGMIPVSSIPFFDFVNIMSYDTIGPSWGIPGVEHSTYAQAVSDVNLWKSRGLSQEKLVLGVPFYGYGFGTYEPNYAYKDIISKFGLDASEKDLIGTACANCNYITYNGTITIKNKTRLALQQGAGVMIWELSQDVIGSASLLKAIHTEMQQGNVSSISASSATNVASSSSVSSVSQSPGKSRGGSFHFSELLILAVIGIFMRTAIIKYSSLKCSSLKNSSKQ